MYCRPRRHYGNRYTQDVSPLLHEVVGDKVTLNRKFDCGARQGTWKGSPFNEIDVVPPEETIPNEIKSLDLTGGGLKFEEAVPLLFDAVTDSIERHWLPDKFHVAFVSGGWDSRIISAAIKRLVDRHGSEWIEGGLLFLSNRWEAEEARQVIIDAQGWNAKYFTAYTAGPEDEHFADALDFNNFWCTSNPPLPICGNLWWYLPAWAQRMGLMPQDDEQLQGFAGLFANETWTWWNRGGPKLWLEKHIDWYYYAAMAMYPPKIPLMEYPIADVEVLKIVIKAEKTNGDKLREAVANYACPEAKDVTHFMHDDRGYVNPDGKRQGAHPISRRLQRQCQEDYHGSWYARHAHGKWSCPTTSEYNPGWCQWSLAALCEELVRRGVDIK